MSKNIIVAIFLGINAVFFSISAFTQGTNIGSQALCEEGMKYYEQGLSRLAAEYFRRCLEQDPSNQQAKKYLGIIGQSYVVAAEESARERYEVARDIAGMPRSETTFPSYTQSTSRNLDYRTAETPSVVIQQKTPVTQYSTQEAAEEAQADFASQYDIREEAIAAARQDYALEQQKKERLKNRKTPRERSEKINKALEDARLKMNFEYMFVWEGEQSFRIVADNDRQLSKLTYPIKRGMGLATVELKLTPRIFIGGRYGTSNFSNETSKDEDWNVWSGWIGLPANYQLTEQDNKNKAQLWDANLYLRLYDQKGENIDHYLAELLMIDRLYLDIFGGYQYYKARHTMIDPVKDVLVQDNIVGLWWTIDPLPYSPGLNSAWEVIYKGPRLGMRFGGSFTERLSSSISLSYAWLDTKAFGNWNLRNYNFWMRGNGGSAFTVDVNAEYHITPNWFANLGFHFMDLHQPSALETGHYPGVSYTDEDIVREIDMRVFGPSLGFGCRF